MSGGSYNYLYRKVDLLFPDDTEEQIKYMAERLEGLGYANDAARATRAIQTMMTDLTDAMEALSDVWQGVEWWDSGDSGEQTFQVDLAKWRVQHPADDKRPSVAEAAKNVRVTLREHADIEKRLDAENERHGALMRAFQESHERIHRAKCELVNAAQEDPGEA